MLDVQGGAGHGEQSGQVGIRSVGRKTQSSALEMNAGLTSQTLWRNRCTDVRNHKHLECIFSVVKFSVFKQFQTDLLKHNITDDMNKGNEPKSNPICLLTLVALVHWWRKQQSISTPLVQNWLGTSVACRFRSLSSGGRKQHTKCILIRG